MQRSRQLLVYIFFLSSLFSLATPSYAQVATNGRHAEVSEEIIDHVVSDDFINEQIEKAQLYATQYTDPEFIDAIINADKLIEQKQRDFNNTLFYDASLECGSLYVPMGIYNADIQNVAHLGATWTIEWWLHQSMTNLITHAHLENLISQGKTSPWNSKIITILFMYALANVAGQRTISHYLLHEAPPTPLTPQPISSLLPSATKIPLPINFSPQAWTMMVNGFFKQLGWLPPWTEHFAWELTKEFLTLVMWAWWHEHNVIRPALQQRIHNNQETFDTALATLRQLQQKETLTQEEKYAAAEIYKALHIFVFDSIHKPFTHWLLHKTTQLSFWHTVTNVLVATPAWYRAGTWVYQMYNNIDNNNFMDPETSSG